jgi:hypothetical protein
MTAAPGDFRCGSGALAALTVTARLDNSAKKAHQRFRRVHDTHTSLLQDNARTSLRPARDFLHANA